LRHETLIGLGLWHVLAQNLEALSELHAVLVYHVGEHEGRGARAALHRLDEYFASLIQCFLNETVRCSEVPFSVLSLLVLNLQVEVFKVLAAQSVGLARHI